MLRGSKWRPAVAAKWRERLARWQKSTCSIAEFCRAEGISPPSFHLWRRRLNGEKKKVRDGKLRGGFVSVEVVPERLSARPQAEGMECELVVGPLVCRVPRGSDEGTLRRLIRVLVQEGRSC